MAVGVLMLTGAGAAPAAAAVPAAPSYDIQAAAGTAYRLYQVYFLREPDCDGFDYWLDLHRNGYSFTAISEQFTRSGEFSDRYGPLSNRDLITLVYNHALGRSPDASGFSYWLGQMEIHGMSRGEMMLYVSNSTEFQARHPGAGPCGSEPTFDASFGAATPEALALLDFSKRHQLEAVRLNVTIAGLGRDDLYRVDQSRVALLVPGTCAQFCEGDAYEITFRDVDSVRDAALYFDSGAWVIRGRFVVASVQIETGGIYSIALRAAAGA